MSAIHERNDENKITFALVQRLFGLLWPYRRAYAAVCAFGLVIASLDMIPPKLVGRAIDLMSGGSFEMSTIYQMAALWIAIAVVVQSLHGLQVWIANSRGERVLSELRESIFVQLQRLSMSFYDRTHAGRILTMTGSDVDSIRGVLIWGLNTLIANGALMLLAAMMIFYTDPSLFFATAWLAPALTVLNALYGQKVAKAWQIVRRHSSAVGANQAENIAGVRVVLAFNRQDENLAHFNQLQDLNTENNVMAARKAGLMQPMLHWVRFLGLAIILTLGGYRVASHTLQPGNLVAVILYWDWFMAPAINFGTFFNELLIALSGAERIFALLDEEPDVADAVDATDLPMIEGHVRFENVSFRYRSSARRILDRVNFEVAAGSTVALVGTTGSGKSTIMSLLARFYQPEDGRVLVDGHDIAKVTGRSLHRQTAIVLQSNFLFRGTVIENLRYGRPEASDEEIFEAAKHLGCHERFLELAKGYDTDVGEKGTALSLGERQLVCFTRALVARPRILLLDEATSALDPLTAAQVQRALSRLVSGRTAFIVTHRLTTARHADLILVVDHGQIREMGRHHELLAQNGKYAELFRSSQSGARAKAIGRAPVHV